MKIKYVVAQPLIGGMALGFEDVIGHPPAAIITAGGANDKHYINYMNVTKRKNVPVIYMNGSYTEFVTPEDEGLYNKICKKVDIFVSVPACAGLSMLNSCNSDCSTKRRGDPNNDQNQNQYQLNSLGFRMGAKVVVYENAPAIYTATGEATINHLRGIADSFKYTTHVVKVDTLNHGIPQCRKRTFISFYRDTNPPKFNYERVDYIPLAEYLAMIPTDAPYKGVYASNDQFDVFYEFVTAYHQTTDFRVIRDKLGIKKDSVSSMSLMHKTGIDTALDWFNKKFEETGEVKYSRGARVCEHIKTKDAANKGWWDASNILFNNGLYTNAIISKSLVSTLHPVEQRTLDVREAMWLMGMPHDFRFYDDNVKTGLHHVTQNVPVTTAKYPAKQILAYLRNELDILDSDYVKQNNETQTLDFPKMKEVSTHTGPKLF
jgi:site-specific DNA-cytosine methylase